MDWTQTDPKGISKQCNQVVQIPSAFIIATLLFLSVPTPLFSWKIFYKQLTSNERSWTQFTIYQQQPEVNI